MVFVYPPKFTLCAPHGLPIHTDWARVNTTPQPGPSCVVVVRPEAPKQSHNYINYHLLAVLLLFIRGTACNAAPSLAITTTQSTDRSTARPSRDPFIDETEDICRLYITRKTFHSQSRGAFPICNRPTAAAHYPLELIRN